MDNLISGHWIENTLFLMVFISVQINICMKKKIHLTDKEFEILRFTKRDMAYASGWLRNNGMVTTGFENVDLKLLKAQREAFDLLKNYQHLLTKAQIKTLQRFRRKMKLKKIRDQLKSEAANPIFNISTKVVRILHRQAHEK